MVIVLVDVCVWGLAHLRNFFALSLVGVVDTKFDCGFVSLRRGKVDIVLLCTSPSFYCS